MPTQRRALVALLSLALTACSSSAPPPPSAATAAPAMTVLAVAPTLPAPTATPAPLAYPWGATVPVPAPTGLYADAAQPLGPVSRLSFGTNIGPWTTIPLDTADDAAAAGLTWLRFPGGEWGDHNDLTGAQIDAYIAQCRALGAQPAISVRLLGGSPERAAALVRYVNIEKKYDVRYWSIGNEPTLYATRDQVDYDTARHNREWRAMALAMRAVDPTIQLVGPDIHQFDVSGGPRDAAGRQWLREFLQANGDLVSVVAIHRYPFPKQPSDPSPTAADLRANSPEWDALIPALRSIIRDVTGHDLPVAVTEVNSNWTGAARGDATPDTLASAIWWADVLGRLIQQRTDQVGHFAIYGPGRQGWGLIEKFKVRPAYYVFQLYGRFGSELIYSSSADPLVALFAARRPDGALTLMLVNRADTARTLPLQLANVIGDHPAEAWRLDAEHLGTALTALTLGPASTITLPATSATLLIIPTR